MFPTSYTATHDDEAWAVGPDGLFDPDRWYVVIPDQFSNGVSSSAADDPSYPALVTAADNVHAQRRLLDSLGVRRVAAAYSFSMGAIQNYHWAALYPDLVARAIIVCGSARTAVHNKVFLSGLLRILGAAPEHLGATARLSATARSRTRPPAGRAGSSGPTGCSTSGAGPSTSTPWPSTTRRAASSTSCRSPGRCASAARPTGRPPPVYEGAVHNPRGQDVRFGLPCGA